MIKITIKLKDEQKAYRKRLALFLISGQNFARI